MNFQVLISGNSSLFGYRLIMAHNIAFSQKSDKCSPKFIFFCIYRRSKFSNYEVRYLDTGTFISVSLIITKAIFKISSQYSHVLLFILYKQIHIFDLEKNAYLYIRNRSSFAAKCKNRQRSRFFIIIFFPKIMMISFDLEVKKTWVHLRQLSI